MVDVLIIFYGKNSPEDKEMIPPIGTFYLADMRRNNKLIINTQRYICSSKILNILDYPNLDLLLTKNDIYLKYPSMPLKKTIIYNPARGCNGSCPFCGGGKISQKLIYKRSHVLLPSLESVLNTFKKIKKLNIDFLFIPFNIPICEKILFRVI